MAAILLLLALSLPAPQVMPRGVVLTHSPDWQGQSNDPAPVINEIQAGSSSWYVYSLGYACRSLGVLEATAQDRTASVIKSSAAASQVGGELWRYVGPNLWGTIDENLNMAGSGHVEFAYTGSALGFPEAAATFDLLMKYWSSSFGPAEIHLALNQGTESGSGDPDWLAWLQALMNLWGITLPSYSSGTWGIPAALSDSKRIQKIAPGERYEMTLNTDVHGAAVADGNWLAGVVTSTAEGDVEANGFIRLY